MKRHALLLTAATLLGAGFLLSLSQAQACVGYGNAGNYTSIINNCSYTIIGKYRAPDRTGGFGPIRPGGREAVYPRAGTYLNVTYCDYTLWTRNQCRLN